MKLKPRCHQLGPYVCDQFIHTLKNFSLNAVNLGELDRLQVGALSHGLLFQLQIAGKRCPGYHSSGVLDSHITRGSDCFPSKFSVKYLEGY